jgi:hypothetical protein
MSLYSSQLAIKAGLDLIDRQQVAEKCRLYKSMNPHGVIPSEKLSTKEGQSIILRDSYSNVLKHYIL